MFGPFIKQIYLNVNLSYRTFAFISFWLFLCNSFEDKQHYFDSESWIFRDFNISQDKLFDHSVENVYIGLRLFEK